MIFTDTYSDATRLAELIRTRQVSPVEVVQAYLDRIEEIDPKLNAVVSLNDSAKQQAMLAEAAVLRGDELGPFHGVPITVKDSIDTQGIPTQRGSPIFRGRVPDKDATVVKRMKDAGAIVLAKTNLPEFSYWTETDNLLTGRTNNPWNLERTPGGSSGGESAAIAAGLSPFGLGSDVAISLRGPAAHTGVIALKATHGRIPMTGLWPRVPRRFWHVGPMARSVRDISLGYSLLAGPDGADGYSHNPPSPDAVAGFRADRPLRIGWLVEPGFGLIDPDIATAVKAAANALGDAGCDIDEVRIPALEERDWIEVFWNLQVMEAKPNFHEATTGHEDDVFTYVQAVFDTPDTPIAEYVKSEQAVENLKDGFAEYFQRFDALICPVTPVPAPPHGATEFTIKGQRVPALHVMHATVPFNITGLPALSMRFGTSHDGLPVAVQIVAPWRAESTVLHLAALLETASPVRDLHPPI